MYKLTSAKLANITSGKVGFIEKKSIKIKITYYQWNNRSILIITVTLYGLI